MMRAPILASLLLLGGCISLLPEPPPPPRIFVLEAADVQRVAGTTIDGVIAVSEPGGERTLLGSDLVWRTGDELAFVAQTQWSTRSAEALQAMLVETLMRQGRFSAATRSGNGRADYEIRWDLLDFQVDDASMMARFVANVSVTAAPGRRIIAQEIISAEAPVSDRSSSVAAQALARAAREGGARIGMFAADAAARAEAQAAAERDQASAASINR